MITVAGFNTALDRRITLHGALQPGRVQRAHGGRMYAGGKGLHVAQMIAELGEPVRLVGLSDARHADFLAETLRGRGVQWHPVPCDADLRHCLAIEDAQGQVTEILEPGPELSAARCETLLATLRACARDADALVLSGSLPRGLAPDTYADLAREAAGRELPCLVDVSGAALRSVVASRAWLVKPNAEEAAEWAGTVVRDVEDAVRCARQLHRQGVARAVVTLGADGAVGFDGERAWHASLPLDGVRNAVGSGDCFLAGLAVAQVRGLDLGEALGLATACGAANALQEEPGFAERERVQHLQQRVSVRMVGHVDAP